jgi:hypothetical protein
MTEQEIKAQLLEIATLPLAELVPAGRALTKAVKDQFGGTEALTALPEWRALVKARGREIAAYRMPLQEGKP